MTIAENIIKLRKLFGVTQRELGAVAGVSENAVSKWENGYSEPRMGAIERMAACYGLTKMNIIEDGGMDMIDPLTKRPREEARRTLNTNGAPMAKVPLVGNTHAGKPCLPEELDEFPEVLVPQFLLDRDPGSYGLEVDGETVRLYFHGASTGTKYDLIAKNPNVAFEMDRGHALILDDEHGNCTMTYESVIGQGRIAVVPDADKERALRVLMAQYRAPDFPYSKAVIPATTVLCLTVEHMTGKRRAKKHG